MRALMKDTEFGGSSSIKKFVELNVNAARYNSRWSTADLFKESRLLACDTIVYYCYLDK